MKIASASQMKKVDWSAINEYGVPSCVLMENAGAASARIITEHFKDARRFTVLCGKGNNGGDGFVCARHLFNQGMEVAIVFLSEGTSPKGDALLNYDLAKRFGVTIIEELNERAVAAIRRCDVLIDALLGIGSNGNLRGAARDCVQTAASSGKPVAAIDMPTGITCDDGVFLQADITITFGLLKHELALYPWKERAGKVIVSDISFPAGAVEKQGITDTLLDRDIAARFLPKRSDATYKGSYGHVFTLAGSVGMTGAAALTATASIKSGCGLVTLGIPSSLNAIMEEKLTEVMTVPLPEESGRLNASASKEIARRAAKSSCTVCGCGLGSSNGVTAAVVAVLSSPSPVVLDADGINAVCSNKSLLQNRTGDTIITPHIGEMARLMGMNSNEISNNTVAVAKQCASAYKIIVVLKSAHTVIAAPDGTCYIFNEGCNGMATAGSGDVLSGVIGSFIAQGISPLEAAACGVYVHGSAGVLAAKELGCHGMTAADILSYLPYAIKRLC